MAQRKSKSKKWRHPLSHHYNQCCIWKSRQQHSSGKFVGVFQMKIQPVFFSFFFFFTLEFNSLRLLHYSVAVLVSNNWQRRPGLRLGFAAARTALWGNTLSRNVHCCPAMVLYTSVPEQNVVCRRIKFTTHVLHKHRRKGYTDRNYLNVDSAIFS